MRANVKFVQELVVLMHGLTPDEIAAKLRDVPTRNLVIAREAAREVGHLQLIFPDDVRMIEVAVKREIDRRWE